MPCMCGSRTTNLRHPVRTMAGHGSCSCSHTTCRLAALSNGARRGVPARRLASLVAAHRRKVAPRSELTRGVPRGRNRGPSWGDQCQFLRTLLRLRVQRAPPPSRASAAHARRWRSVLSVVLNEPAVAAAPAPHGPLRQWTHGADINRHEKKVKQKCTSSGRPAAPTSPAYVIHHMSHRRRPSAAMMFFFTNFFPWQVF